MNKKHLSKIKNSKMGLSDSSKIMVKQKNLNVTNGEINTLISATLTKQDPNATYITEQPMLYASNGQSRDKPRGENVRIA